MKTEHVVLALVAVAVGAGIWWYKKGQRSALPPAASITNGQPQFGMVFTTFSPMPSKRDLLRPPGG